MTLPMCLLYHWRNIITYDQLIHILVIFSKTRGFFYLERLRLFSRRLIWKSGSQKISPTEKIMAYFPPRNLLTKIIAHFKQPKDLLKNYGNQAAKIMAHFPPV